MNEYLVHFPLLSNQCKKICRNLNHINSLFPTLRRSLWNYPEHINISRVLPRECTGHSKHPLPTQEKTLHMDITRNQIDYILCSQRWRSSIQSAKTRPGADCGSDHELLIAKFRLKLKKVGKTTRPFRYELNQIPYDYPGDMIQWK